MADYVAGKGTTALATVGTVLGSLATAGMLGDGGLGGLFGGGSAKEPTVTRYELQQEQKIAELQTQVALRDANIYSDQKLLALWEKVDGELKEMRRESCNKWADQCVINAKIDAGMSALNANLSGISATVNAITKTAIPRSAICDFGDGCCNPCGNI